MEPTRYHFYVRDRHKNNPSSKHFKSHVFILRLFFDVHFIACLFDVPIHELKNIFPA